MKTERGFTTTSLHSRGFTTFMKTERGFTLIELLVVVSIIVILSAIGIVLFSNAQQNARDGKRRADLDAIAKSLEVNFGKDVTQAYKLDPDTFNSKKIPIESQTGRPPYCFKYDTSRTPTLVPNPSAWTTCPGGWEPLNSGTVIPLTDNDGIVWWKVCAVLEKGSEVICKDSTQ